MDDIQKNLAQIKGMPVESATSVKPLEIKGKKPNVKLNNGHGLINITKKGRLD